MSFCFLRGTQTEPVLYMIYKPQLDRIMDLYSMLEPSAHHMYSRKIVSHLPFGVKPAEKQREGESMKSAQTCRMFVIGPNHGLMHAHEAKIIHRGAG